MLPLAVDVRRHDLTFIFAIGIFPRRGIFIGRCPANSLKFKKSLFMNSSEQQFIVTILKCNDYGCNSSQSNMPRLLFKFAVTDINMIMKQCRSIGQIQQTTISNLNYCNDVCGS